MTILFMFLILQFQYVFNHNTTLRFNQHKKIIYKCIIIYPANASLARTSFNK